MSELHALLERQLKRIGIETGTGVPAEGPWHELLERVSRAYAEHDQERHLLQRSQDLASRETQAMVATLRTERDQLDQRVHERTEALHLSEGRLGNLLQLSADWIWEQDAELRFSYFSHGLQAATGIAPHELLGQLRPYTPSFDGDAETSARYTASIENRQAFRDFTYGMTRADGARRYIRISGEPVFDADGRFAGYRGVGRDVTQATLAELKVQELARFDGLTGLPNRNMFLSELERAIARARRSGGRFAVCFIDLDRFKVINDTLGHSAGDELLKLMASRLRRTLRDSDLVARLGGDEFVVLIDGDCGVASLRALAAKLLTAIAEPMTLHGCSFLVTGSVGLSVFPADGEDADTLLKHADAAMYLAKEKGKNNLQFYTAELAEQAAREFALEAELRLALSRDELMLLYQPKIDLASGRMQSVEALVRWNHPTRGLLLPRDFMALAEERGLMAPLGRWVLQAACRQLREWRNAGKETPPVAVNLSARQFAGAGLLDDIFDALVQHGLDPTDLEIELTESVLMADPERATSILQRLHSLGVRIAIDDFGTGYSALSYLRRFPARAVKIDGSLVRGLPASPEDTAVTRAVIAMAHSLGLGVIAEGVETAAQLELLRALGCDEAQGHLLGHPVEGREIGARLAPRQAPAGRAA